MQRRDMHEERLWIRRRLQEVLVYVKGALEADGGLSTSPQTRRAQTLKVKAAAQRLNRVHHAILLGKGRSK